MTGTEDTGLRRPGRPGSGWRGSGWRGWLGLPAAAARPRPPAGAGPGFPGPRRARRGPAAGWLAGGLAGVVVIAAGAVLAGWWFLPFAVGVAGGAVSRRRRLRPRAALPGVLAVAAAGWAVPLAWAAVAGQPVAGVARAVAALAGLPAHAAVIVAVALAVAMLQAAAGLWLGRTVAPRPPGDPRQAR